MRYRDLTKMQKINDGTRSLYESVMMNEIIKALEDWISMCKTGVLIGGIGISFHVKPRMTQDIDFLFLNKSEIPEQIPGFKRTRPGAFQHNKTHVEVEVVTPKSINLPDDMVKTVLNTAIESNGVKIATPSALVALKLFRLSYQDKADIAAIVQWLPVDLNPFNLSQKQLDAFDIIKNEVQQNPHVHPSTKDDL